MKTRKVNQMDGEFIPSTCISDNLPYYIKGHVKDEEAKAILRRSCEIEVDTVARKFARRFAVGPEHPTFLDGLESPLRVIDFPRRSYYPVTECLAVAEDNRFDKNGQVRQEWQDGYDDFYAQFPVARRDHKSSRRFGFWFAGWDYARDQAVGKTSPQKIEMRVNVQQLIRQVEAAPRKEMSGFCGNDGATLSCGGLLKELRAVSAAGIADLPLR